MSAFDSVTLDAEGYLDMDQFPDDGSDLVGADLSELRDALLSDPVEEPSADEWTTLLDAVASEAGPDGPFALDDPDGTTYAYGGIDDDGEAGAPALAPADDDDHTVEGDDTGPDDVGSDDGEGPVDPLDALDVGDDGLGSVDGLDLFDDAGGDDGSALDGDHDALPSVGPDLEDYF